MVWNSSLGQKTRHFVQFWNGLNDHSHSETGQNCLVFKCLVHFGGNFLTIQKPDNHLKTRRRFFEKSNGSSVQVSDIWTFTAMDVLKF
jgi:hypothetical protein